jgi:hypothetical protein
MSSPQKPTGAPKSGAAAPLPDEAFRRAFHQQRLTLVRSHGVEAYDQGEVLYQCGACGAPTVVRDAFYGREPAGPVEVFAAALAERWFAARASLRVEACSKCGAPGPQAAARALYAHALPEVGFDVAWEVEPTGPLLREIDPDEAPRAAVTRCWRMDARGKVTRIPPARSELDFRDQTGTFFDLRAGWRALVAAYRRQTGDRRGTTLIAEVQSGYIIGVREGRPGDPDPAARHDPHLEAHFGGFERRTYDMLEFLGRMDPASTPFVGELYDEWLGEATSAVAAGELELFILADSSEYLACIEDFCAHRGVAVEWIDPDDDLRVAFHLDEVRIEAAFAYPFLRTLHTARTFHAGARLFYAPIVTALEDAADILEIIRQEIDGETYPVDVLNGALLRIRDGADGREIGRWNLMTIAGRLAFRSQEGVTALLNLLGYDRETRRFRPARVSLAQCPLCGEPARIGKVLRPTALADVDRASLVGADVGEHFIYFTHECPVHSTPVQPGPGRSLTALEAAWDEGQDAARLVLVDARPLTLGGVPATLLVGFEVGSLVLEPARLKRALERVESDGVPPEGLVSAYAFFPDALIVAATPLNAAARRDARLVALEAVQPRFPARVWPLDVARKVALPDEGRGEVERPA